MTAIAFDPADVDAIRTQLEQFLRERSWDVRIDPAIHRFAGGLDTYIYGVTLRGTLPEGWPTRVVLRVYPAADQGPKMEREFAVQRFMGGRGFPAPRPLLAGKADEVWSLPFMLMERVEGSLSTSGFTNPLRMRGMIRAMAALQARLHSLPIDGCPLPYEGPLVDRMLAEPREIIEKYPAPELARGLRWVEENAGIVREEEPVLVHNDLHPVNVLAQRRRLTLLDWPDADIGDRHSDVARTLGVFKGAEFMASGPIGRTAPGFLRRYTVSNYLRDYATHFPLDARRLRYWEVLHGFRELVTVETMDREGAAALGGRDGLVAETEGFAEQLRRYFEERSGLKL